MIGIHIHIYIYILEDMLNMYTVIYTGMFICYNPHLWLLSMLTIEIKPEWCSTIDIQLSCYWDDDRDIS